MMLRPDGKPYKAAGSMRQFNPNSRQHDLFNLWDQQAIKQGGTPLYYYEVFIPTGEIDKTYWEARGKIYSKNPIEIWGTYDPMPDQNYMNSFGFTAPADQIVDCNAKAVIKAIGHMPKIGARLYTPHLGHNWEIVQRNLGEYKMWGALRVQLVLKSFTESLTTQEGKVTDTSPNIPKPI